MPTRETSSPRGVWLIFLSYLASFGALAFFSYSRNDFFLQTLEVFSLPKAVLLFWIFSLFFLIYLLLWLLKPSLNRAAVFSIVCILAVGYITPPLLSVDIAGYVSGAKLLFVQHLNPYASPLSAVQDWSMIFSRVWWFSFPFPYGPSMLLLGLPVALLPHTSILFSVYAFKSLVLIAFIATFFVFRKIRRARSLPDHYDLLFIANPSLLLNVVIEGHNEIFIIFFLLLFFAWQDKRGTASISALLFGTFIKYNALIFWPITWFKNNKFSLSAFWLSNCLLLAVGLLFFWLCGQSFSQIASQAVFFLGHDCFYRCSPLLILLGPSPLGSITRLFLFVAVYLYAAHRYLLLNFSPLRFIFWAGMALLFIQTTWLTPWYPALLIPIGLLCRGRGYRYLVIALTFFGLFHYFGLI